MSSWASEAKAESGSFESLKAKTMVNTYSCIPFFLLDIFFLLDKQQDPTVLFLTHCLPVCGLQWLESGPQLRCWAIFYQKFAPVIVHTTI